LTENAETIRILWYFLIYSCMGWGLEVAYHAVTLGKVVNRGFLNGPVCPVYGFGVLAILSFFGRIEEAVGSGSGIILFFSGMLVTTAIELLAGWSLDRLFHARWWDYSNHPFHFHGYICLEFSLYWGLGTVFVYRIVHPTVRLLAAFLTAFRFELLLLILLYLVLITDVCVTAATVRGLNSRLEELDELRRKLRIVSDSMSGQIAENAIRTKQRLDEGAEMTRVLVEEKKEQARQLKEEKQKEAAQLLEELQARYEEVRRKLYANQSFGAGRIARAFPHAVHAHYNELLKEFREKLESKEDGGDGAKTHRKG